MKYHMCVDMQTKCVRCRQCDNCLKLDCGVCSNYLDKKFGGLGKKKQACVYRKCLQLQSGEVASF